MLGLPKPVSGCLFDMDGVLTRTAAVHAAAWRQMFDEFLRSWSQQHGEPFRAFDPVADYDRYVDGRPRHDGIRTFLAAREILLPEGRPDDAPGTATVYGLGNRKNDLLQERLAAGGVEVFDGSVRYLAAARDAGVSRAVVSSSTNTRQVLAAAGIAEMFDACVDGVQAERQQLAGKPAPDMYLAAARELDVPAAAAAVFEDALAGVAAGRAGGFAVVVGVDRTGQAQALREHGADLVVADLADLLEQP